MRRIWLLVALLIVCPALALGGSAVQWTQTPELLRPGKQMVMRFDAPKGQAVDLQLLDKQGNAVRMLARGVTRRSVSWDGGGVAQGEYILRLICDGAYADARVTIGAPAPVLTLLDAPDASDGDWTLRFHASMAGTVVGRLEDGRTLFCAETAQGESSLVWSGDADGESLPDGVYDVLLTLVDGTGCASAAQSVTVMLSRPAQPRPAHSAEKITPNQAAGTSCGHENCYWNLSMGELDESLVWAALTAPVTVLDGSERRQYRVRREPDSACTNFVGEVTCASQAVHVLERGETWSLIEAYSSSVEGSGVGVWAECFTGYVETALLREVQVSQHTGIVIDKLQQRLYLYVDGALYSTLLCSTGYARADTPFNETPAGEFLCISWTGGFWSGSLFCDMGIRICDGIMLHEVPCLIAEDGTRDYSRCERYLGEKASHGCIRIQREKTPEGVNMKWLWENLSRPKQGMTKVIIWDDTDRTFACPDEDYPLYYNPDNGRQYHSDPQCMLVHTRFWPLTAFRWGELDEKPYSRLTRCPGCAPQLRREEIEKINSAKKRP